jgi:hypothetical protein
MISISGLQDLFHQLNIPTDKPLTVDFTANIQCNKQDFINRGRNDIQFSSTETYPAAPTLTDYDRILSDLAASHYEGNLQRCSFLFWLQCSKRENKVAQMHKSRQIKRYFRTWKQLFQSKQRLKSSRQENLNKGKVFSDYKNCILLDATFKHWLQLHSHLKQERINSLRLVWSVWRDRIGDIYQQKRIESRSLKYYSIQNKQQALTRWLYFHRMKRIQRCNNQLAQSFRQRELSSQILAKLSQYSRSRKLHAQYLTAAHNFNRQQQKSNAFHYWLYLLRLRTANKHRLIFAEAYYDSHLMPDYFFVWKQQTALKQRVNQLKAIQNQHLSKTMWKLWRENWSRTSEETHHRVKKLTAFIAKVSLRAWLKLTWKYWKKYLQQAQQMNAQAIRLRESRELCKMQLCFASWRDQTMKHRIELEQANHFAGQKLQQQTVLLFKYWLFLSRQTRLAIENSRKLVQSRSMLCFKHWLQRTKSYLAHEKQCDALLPKFLHNNQRGRVKRLLKHWITLAAKRNQANHSKLLLFKQSVKQIGQVHAIRALINNSKRKHRSALSKAAIFNTYSQLKRAVNGLSLKNSHLSQGSKSVIEGELVDNSNQRYRFLFDLQLNQANPAAGNNFSAKQRARMFYVYSCLKHHWLCWRDLSRERANEAIIAQQSKQWKNKRKQKVLAFWANQTRENIVEKQQIVQTQQIQEQREQEAGLFHARFILKNALARWKSLARRENELESRFLSSALALQMLRHRLAHYFEPWLRRARRLINVHRIDAALVIIWQRNVFLAWLERVRKNRQSERLFYLSRSFSAWKLSWRRIEEKRNQLARNQSPDKIIRD